MAKKKQTVYQKTLRRMQRQGMPKAAAKKAARRAQNKANAKRGK